MKKTTLIFLAFTLAACQSSSEGATPTPQVTVTSEVTATLTPPAPTLTPESALPAEIQELQKSLAGTDYRFKWNDDLKTLALTHTTPETEKTVVIPEIVFEKGNWKRTYTLKPYMEQKQK
ncbi:MAG: hypothetical protein IPG80_08785 [Anaerolineales bacterium]|uniref:hypothetical protein n=1 Tax=Candidatus Villigracilis vicinus TaxID=3140679 RepID=UPI00313744BE|nr:hypothetical protein [Anaerolineales bacterium]